MNRVAKRVQAQLAAHQLPQCIDPEGNAGVQIAQALSQLDPSTARAVMHPCGAACCGKDVRQQARALYAQSPGDLDSFLARLNAQGIGGGQLRLEGNKVIGVYTQCYCPVARGNPEMPAQFCACSEGWYAALFEAALGSPVRVRALETRLSGANQCTFEIEL